MFAASTMIAGPAASSRLRAKIQETSNVSPRQRFAPNLQPSDGVDLIVNVASTRRDSHPSSAENTTAAWRRLGLTLMLNSLHVAGGTSAHVRTGARAHSPTIRGD